LAGQDYYLLNRTSLTWRTLCFFKSPFFSTDRRYVAALSLRDEEAYAPAQHLAAQFDALFAVF
jgi:hypothetical protein